MSTILQYAMLAVGLISLQHKAYYNKFIVTTIKERIYVTYPFNSQRLWPAVMTVIMFLFISGRKYVTHPEGNCNALRLQPFLCSNSPSRNISNSFDPNATTVVAGLPKINKPSNLRSLQYINFTVIMQKTNEPLKQS